MLAPCYTAPGCLVDPTAISQIPEVVTLLGPRWQQGLSGRQPEFDQLQNSTSRSGGLVGHLFGAECGDRLLFGHGDEPASRPNPVTSYPLPWRPSLAATKIAGTLGKANCRGSVQRRLSDSSEIVGASTMIGSIPSAPRRCVLAPLDCRVRHWCWSCRRRARLVILLNRLGLGTPQTFQPLQGN